MYVQIGIALAFLVVAAPMISAGHGGGLDAAGCHHETATGEYHCHRGSESEPEVTTAIVGQASVIDGDTIEIRGVRVRLHGIDAPESAQTCEDATGAVYPCGRRAAFALDNQIGSRTVFCEQRDTDRYGRAIAVCSAEDEDLNRWMVEQGWAIAYRKYSTDYVEAEEHARAADKGIWEGRFIEPEEWRRG